MKDIIYIDAEWDQSRHVFTMHTLDLRDSEQNRVRHPEDAEKTMSVIEFLLWLNADKARLSAAGYNEVVKMPWARPGATRWDQVVDFAWSDDAPPELFPLREA